MLVRTGHLLAALGFVLGGTLFADESAVPEKKQYAGPTTNGFMLPNGWHLTPAGEHVVLPDLVLNIHPLADGKHVLVASNGFNMHQLSVVSLESKSIVDKVSAYQSWFGLVVSGDEKRVWWAGGGASSILNLGLAGQDLSMLPTPKTLQFKKEGVRPDKMFRGGLALDEGRGLLYSLDVEQGTISAIDLSGEKATREGAIGVRPYDIAIGPDGRYLYVSDWAKRQVIVVDPETFQVDARIAVGEHPTQIVRHPKDDRLFVVCASSNSVAVIDSSRGVVIETIMTTLFPKAPEGSTPEALAITPDGETLFVANADNNCVAVIEIEEPAKSQVRGFIPTGWYPTSLAVTRDGKNLLVGVGKGLQSKANPFGQVKEEEPKEGEGRPKRKLPYPYIGTTLSGALSIVPIPGEEKLREYTAQVYKNCPYSDDLLSGAKYSEKTVIPTKVGEASPITHVIYIIKENRTYDQVFSDIPGGNGDPSLLMFGEEVTPNAHKLAKEFVLLDNLYCNGQVSRDGHPWSTMAYNTDWIARDWMLTYSGRAGIDDDDDADLSRSPSGYIWDACKRAGVSYRNYGEYGNRVSQADGSVTMEARVPGLIGHISPKFGLPRVPGTRPRDPDNVDTFIEEFNEYLKTDSLPRMIVMSLGEDHTTGTAPGTFTPEACVASNDLAVGRLVEAVSHSKIWPNVAIFMIEDDAQNGPDHVDAHRTIGLVISPYTKRRYIDSTQYSTVSMLRTIELILGLDPLSQYDAAATAMFRSFTDKPNLEPYTHEPPRIDLNLKNTLLSYGAERSAKMDFSEYDLIDDFEMNEILWRAIKGENAPMPPAVRRAIAYRMGQSPSAP
ncbi:beta-propeller fold lactonase family protein [bacterium]|nr:beta-propeller fold lactonase family protein [bacterium]